AMRLLCSFNFPGNIRQLENFCQWLTVMSSGQLIEAKDLPPEVLEHAQASTGQAAGDPAHTQAAGPLTAGAPEADGAALPEADAAQAPWIRALTQEAGRRLTRNEPAVMVTLMRDFERVLLETALAHSRGRRMEAAQRLGIGRNTLTRKCAELGLDD